MMNDIICKVIDEYVPDLRWIAHLSNGETIYQDDERPEMEPRSAWIRLGNYIRNNNLKIISLKFQFRSHVINLEDNADGYYFAKGAVAVWGIGETFHHFVAGTLKEGKIHKKWFLVPELEITRVGEQDASQCGPSLIDNNYAQKTDRSIALPI
jgi:hypothetical protein